METWNRVDFETYRTVAGWLDDNLALLTARYLRATGEIDDTHWRLDSWKLDNFETRQDVITVELSLYVGCNDYEYQSARLPLDYVLADSRQQEEILDSLLIEAQKKKRAEAEHKAKQEEVRRLEQEQQDRQRELALYHRLKIKYEGAS